MAQLTRTLCSWGLMAPAAVVLCAAVGCQDRAEPPPAKLSQQTVAERPTENAGEQPDLREAIELIPADSERLKQWIVAQDATDVKMVLVDFWATWCPPCVEKFPQVVELANTYRSRGLAVVAVSVNELSEAESVKSFLMEQNPQFDQMIAAAPPSQAFEDFNLDAVPTYRLYRPTGELLKDYSESFEFAELVEFVEATLSD